MLTVSGPVTLAKPTATLKLGLPFFALGDLRAISEDPEGNVGSRYPFRESGEAIFWKDCCTTDASRRATHKKDHRRVKQPRCEPDIFQATTSYSLRQGNLARKGTFCCSPSGRRIPHLQWSKYKLLQGVLLDKDFSFVNKVRCLIQVGNALFDELVHTLTLAGFPPPCIALAVTERIDPVILIGCEVLILAEGACTLHFTNVS